MIHYISGGTRSGKSSYAMQLAKSLAERPVYLATARRWDADFEKRIAHHQNERRVGWESVEEEKYVSQVALDGKVVVVDCVTLWLTNIFMDTEQDLQQSLDLFKQEIDALKAKDTTWIIISNELGMGLHAETESGRKFTDLQGWANQYVAAAADTATFMVSGLPMKLKG
ncbi:MAG TPA: adenosylcobinamide kinase/adenosylcobinamide phosphate guanyltransferase [Cytophagales bacterium]|nr:adenosylcobinamide kinase/adenosylcobinamide phosphate guanyltransferase [Cytophagales bacterium]HAA21545.1 adenosylcobinamide kinase/adenosylcobinamide phosphate guanyltransferase [Cytophagales bacterium]HAP64007.1 adenosylcobinamide kinase/adenosylcobinamide phosphate guanyltransferase [Cytophagales bacterium]